MKKLFILFLLFTELSISYGQIKLSQLTEATNINNTDLFLISQGSASRKLQFSTLKAKLGDVPTSYLRLNNLTDSLRIWFDGDSTKFTTSQPYYIFNKKVKAPLFLQGNTDTCGTKSYARSLIIPNTWPIDSSNYASKSYANYVWSKDSAKYASKSMLNDSINDLDFRTNLAQQITSADTTYWGAFPYEKDLITDLLWSSTNGSGYSFFSKDAGNNFTGLSITPTESMLHAGQGVLVQNYISVIPKINTIPSRIKFRAYGLNFPYSYLDVEIDTVGLKMVPNGSTDTSKFSPWHYVPLNWVKKRIDTLNRRTALAQSITTGDTARWGEKIDTFVYSKTLLSDISWQSDVAGTRSIGFGDNVGLNNFYANGSGDYNPYIYFNSNLGISTLGNDSTSLSIGATNLFTDNRITKTGIGYASNYHATLGQYSWTDKSYVDSIASATASNGITKVGNDFQLGGAITGSTNLNLGASGNLVINGSTYPTSSTYVSFADKYNDIIAYGQNSSVASLSMQANGNGSGQTKVSLEALTNGDGKTTSIKVFKGTIEMEVPTVTQYDKTFKIDSIQGCMVNDTSIINYIHYHAPTIITGTDTTNSTPSKKGNIFVDDSGNVYVSKNNSRGGWVKLNWFIPILFFRRKKIA